MAENHGYIAASPDDVFAVLADGWSYSNWVVGTSHMRAVEAQWPAVGAQLFHAAGAWPLATRDRSVVEEVEPGRRLQLVAYGRWLGAARVVLELEPDGDGCAVRMLESPISGPGRGPVRPLTEVMLTRRNTEALARLAAISERRTAPSE
jgi:uncharacterized protein YndB with AHSA1/START domain